MQDKVGLWAAAIALSGFSLGIVASPQAAWAEPADNYVGVGARGGFNDDLAAVVGAKIKVTDFGEFSLSGRPAILIGDEIEYRVALTGEGEVSPDFLIFAGGGLAINTDGSDDIDPLITAGLDYEVTERAIVQVGGNFIFKDGDTDAELITTVNYAL